MTFCISQMRRSAQNAIGITFLMLPFSAVGQVDVLTQHNDNFRTGANIRETVLNPANVNPQHFGMLFKRIVDDQLYTQPLLVTNVKIGGGFHDVVYVTTVNNSVYAFDANDTAVSAPLWHVNFGTPASLHDADFGCTDINGNMGIIGTPVVNDEKHTLYVVSLTKAGGRFMQRLHALDLSTGADLPASPVVIEAPAFDPLMQNQRPALFLTGGNVYVGYASHCDKQPYHGFLIGYNATSLVQVGVVNTSPGGEGASIWQSGQAPAVDENGNIYFITGNGSWDGSTQFSESFIKLDPHMNIVDWFTPTNHLHLDAVDNDLDSAGPLIIPGKHVVLGGGKEGVLYLIDRDHFGHLGDEHAVQFFRATSSHLHNLVYWNSATNGGLLYLWGQKDRLRAYKFSGDRLDEKPWMIRRQRTQGHPGGMLSLSANGEKDGILWAAIHASGDSWHESRPGVLHAFAADNIVRELWNSLQNPARDDCNNYSKMAPATVANGKVYLASFGRKNTGTGQMCVYGLLPNGSPPGPPENVHVAVRNMFITVEWNPVEGTRTYSVERRAEGVTHVVASGLTQPVFTEPATTAGLVAYSVRAANSNGESGPSKSAVVTIDQVPMPRTSHE